MRAWLKLYLASQTQAGLNQVPWGGDLGAARGKGPTHWLLSLPGLANGEMGTARLTHKMRPFSPHFHPYSRLHQKVRPILLNSWLDVYKCPILAEMCLGLVLCSSVRMDVEEPQIKGALGGPDRHWALPQFLRALREKDYLLWSKCLRP